LENRRGKNNKMSRRVWKAVGTKAEKTGVVEVAGERKKKEGKK